ncbi:hypothetical protein J3Q64DRAFT_1642782 [Phycomyces blakesleeanus]|uniref:Rap-GAP domain-containing protein n=1 Tax=Phycomyces blakesleeanus TaxID=4837 RepID=A0ABR3AUR6_PHYBL
MELFSNAISLDLFILDDIYAFPSTTTQNTDAVNVTDDKETINKLQSSVQFVKKLSERHTEKPQGYGLLRDDRIKRSKLTFNQTFILGDEHAPLFPSHSQPTFSDSVVLIHIFISNLVRLAYVAAGSPPPPDDYEYPPGDYVETDDGIATGIGIDAATASAKFLFRIFRTYYLTKFVPAVAKSLHTETLVGFPLCPPSILRTLLRFLIGYCLDNNSNSHAHWAHLPSAPTSSPATPILKSIVLSSHETREMLHEILKQCMVLPCTNPQYRDITRGAIHILGVWVLGNEDERPSFLRKTGGASVGTVGHSMTRSSSIASVATSKNSIVEPKVLSTSPTSSVWRTSDKPESDDGDANIFLRRYFLMIKLLFENKSGSRDRDVLVAQVQQVTDWEGLTALYKDAINLYRAVTVSRGGIEMEDETWELLLRCLLDIQNWFMSPPEKYSRIPVQPLAEEMADFVCETLLHAFVRARLIHASLWIELKEHLLSSIKWSQTLSQWVKIMNKVTRLLAFRLYKVEYEPSLETHRQPLLESHAVQNRYSMQFNANAAPGNRGRTKARTRHLSIQGDRPRTSASNRVAGRPLSAGGSDGQLIDSVNDKTQSGIDTPYETASEATTPVTLRSKISMPAIEPQTADRRSANLSTDIPHIEEPVLDEPIGPSTSTGKQSGVKFGIKNILPTASFSTANNSGSGGNSGGNGPSGNSVGSSLKKRSSGRRTMSIHQLDSLWQDSGNKLMNLVHHSAHHDKHLETPGQAKSATYNGVKEEEEVKKSKPEWDNKSSGSSVERTNPEDGLLPSGKSVRTLASTIISPKEPVKIVSSFETVNEKLPASLGVFRSNEFLTLNGLTLDGQGVLVLWKNMLCAVGNVNLIQGPQNYAVAMRCVVDTWDMLNWIRSKQPYRNVPIPALYEMTPWLLQATELSSEYDAGKADAYGCLCRLVSRRPEEPVPNTYYAHFYKAILRGLGSNDSVIIQAILKNSERIFSFCLPTSIALRKSCVTLLGSLVSITNHLRDTTINIEEYDMGWIQGYNGKEFSFAKCKRWLKELLLRLINNGTTTVHTKEDEEVHCMLMGALSSIILDELLASTTPQPEYVHECIVAIKILQEVLTRVIDALNVHLKSYEANKQNRRGFIISKLFSCLLEWDGSEKMLPRPPVVRPNNHKKKELPFKFKLSNDRGPNDLHEQPNFASWGDIPESDHGYVKESAEAVLLHLLHHFNNFAPPYGPATLHSTIVGPGMVLDEKQENYHQYQYFSFNDTTIIAFVELPATELRSRYVWDSQLEPSRDLTPVNPKATPSYNDPISDILGDDQGYKMRSNISIQKESKPVIGEDNPDCVWDPAVPLDHPSPASQFQTNMVGSLGQQLDEYLRNESDNNEQEESDIQLWYSKMNVLRQKEATEGINDRAESMHAHLMANFSMRKDFLPAFPHESEKPHVPFQQSRLLMSHFGFINYDHLKDGSFRLLNKTPGLYRDLRGLDRKHGRETMKIAVVYVGQNQEDEQSILCNSQGSPMYSSFVKSLGWEVDIATHTGYLGGLEKNLTNGTRTNYYCSSTLEMIFHDVTKMPTDPNDPKQLKKKRHIGNDHVHIVWNEHNRDYRIGTIGGDFGNAQIVVTPMANSLFAIHVHRDPKIPYFGPLFDRMVVSRATLGPLVRATAANAFRASVHTNLYSFYKCVYSHRANDVQTIANRHKVAAW